MDVELLELYPSPFSERLRWALETKNVPYRRRNYRPIVDEAELRQKTGLATVPVLFADGDVIGDSNAGVDWLEARHPTPALLPADPTERAQVRAFELMATETLTPAARLLFIGPCREMNIQPLADHFTAKYGWSPETEARGERLLRVALPELARAVAARPYLVGGTFTRADLTVAAMLVVVLGHPPEDLFSLDPSMRSMFGLPSGGDPALEPLRRWRDDIYRRHRGGQVLPA
jgi:glutathione S-transferase